MADGVGSSRASGTSERRLATVQDADERSGAGGAVVECAGVCNVVGVGGRAAGATVGDPRHANARGPAEGGGDESVRVGAGGVGATVGAGVGTTGAPVGPLTGPLATGASDPLN